VPPEEKPHYPRIFIDRNSGGKTFRAILEEAGMDVCLHDDRFNARTEDHVWLKFASDQNRVVVSGDIRTTHDLTFLRQLKESRAFAFMLRGLNGQTPKGKAECVLSCMALIIRLKLENEPPAVWRISEDGKIAHKVDHNKILGRTGGAA
jgi:hypothetical protein